MKTFRIALVPGDGIGKEVVPAGRQVLEALATGENEFRFEFEHFVSPRAEWVTFGGVLRGEGTAWFDDFKVEVLDTP